MHKNMATAIEKVFSIPKANKIVIVGVGNIMRRDDGLGPVLVNMIKDKTDAVCIDAAGNLENCLGVIIKHNPDRIIFVDALHMEKTAGDYEILQKQDILKRGFTTRNMSPATVIECLEKQTKADIYLLGIQPQNIFFGEELSSGVKRTLKELSGAIIKILNGKIVAKLSNRVYNKA